MDKPNIALGSYKLITIREMDTYMDLRLALSLTLMLTLNGQAVAVSKRCDYPSNPNLTSLLKDKLEIPFNKSMREALNEKPELKTYVATSKALGDRHYLYGENIQMRGNCVVDGLFAVESMSFNQRDMPTEINYSDGIRRTRYCMVFSQNTEMYEIENSFVAKYGKPNKPFKGIAQNSDYYMRSGAYQFSDGNEKYSLGVQINVGVKHSHPRSMVLYTHNNTERYNEQCSTIQKDKSEDDLSKF